MDKRVFIPAIWMLMGLTSCTKVIKVDLNSANPNIVVDAQISDQAGPYTVNLTKTVNFSDDNIFPAVSGAIVILSDNAGNSEMLNETSLGNYTTVNLKGTAGRTYSLSINTNGKTYTAVSTMPDPVTLDSLVVETSSKSGGSGGGSLGNGHKPNGFNVKAIFTDPKGTTNYYRLIECVNSVPNYSNIIVISDKLQDGNTITSYVARKDSSIHSGDTVTVLLQSIDSNVYEYFRELKQLTREQTGIQTAVPGNPTSNLSNKALGFFSAYSVRSKYAVVP